MIEDKDEFEFMCKTYAPYIKNIINDNVRFYRFRETIQWGFYQNDDCSVYAFHNRNTNAVMINLLAVIDSYIHRDFYTIEYFILHEIRHVFQQSEVRDYKAGKETVVNQDLIKKWIYEEEHYNTALNSEGEENPEYFKQDIEMDAYAFAYAVMKYKYKDIGALYVPPLYNSNFYKIVDEWLNAFKEDNL